MNGLRRKDAARRTTACIVFLETRLFTQIFKFVAALLRDDNFFYSFNSVSPVSDSQSVLPKN
jgi:hypothetical protein